jgi:hypothetical protein
MHGAIHIKKKKYFLLFVVDFCGNSFTETDRNRLIKLRKPVYLS